MISWKDGSRVDVSVRGSENQCTRSMVPRWANLNGIQLEDCVQGKNEEGKGISMEKKRKLKKI